MFSKGYKNDAGIDIILNKKVLIKAKRISVIDLGVSIKVKNNQLAILLPRTSAAKKGIYVASCPIDPGYEGNIHAIVYNYSDNDIYYGAGEAFAQIVFTKLSKPLIKYNLKRKGKRGENKFGSTK